jgi:diamine N-acetyltransferase
MTMRLEPIDADNWQQAARLKVREDQTHFVASNLYSIAESHFPFVENDGTTWLHFPFAVFDGNEMVGFAMYSAADRDQKFFIMRLMMDASQQGKGYGKQTMRLLLAHIQRDTTARTISISYHPANDVARKLYAEFGFVETGEMIEGELVAELKIPRNE